MDLKTLEEYIDMLLFVRDNPGVVASVIKERFEITQTRLYKILNEWAESKVVNKKMIKEIGAGDPWYEYSIGSEGTKFLEKLSEKFATEGSTPERVLSKLIKDFYLELPEIFTDLNVKISPEQYDKLRQKIEKFFE